MIVKFINIQRQSTKKIPKTVTFLMMNIQNFFFTEVLAVGWTEDVLINIRLWLILLTIYSRYVKRYIFQVFKFLPVQLRMLRS